MLSQKSVITKKKASVGKVLKRVPEGKLRYRRRRIFCKERSQDEKGQSTAFSFLDLEKYALPLLKEAGVEEAELDLRLLLQEAFSLDTKDYLLGKREAILPYIGKEQKRSRHFRLRELPEI